MTGSILAGLSAGATELIDIPEGIDPYGHLVVVKEEVRSWVEKNDPYTRISTTLQTDPRNNLKSIIQIKRTR
jgi:hypothetical protein